MEVFNQITMKYNMTIEVDQEISANNPDIVIQELTKKTSLFINITALVDINTIKAATKKYKI
eukprot:6607108-Ditylum_brightwellii.AAC.1